MTPAGEKMAVVAESFPCSVCSKASTGLFERVPLCPDCLTEVQHKYGKHREQLERMLCVVRESMRVTLLEGRMPV